MIRALLPTFLKKLLKETCNRLVWQGLYKKVYFVYRNTRGFQTLISPYDGHYLFDKAKRHEKSDEYDVMELLLQSGDTVFDVGANIGDISLFAATLVGPYGRVYAFEPVASARTELHINLLLNEELQERVTVVPCALSDTVGETVMYVFPEAAHPANSLGHVEETMEATKTLIPTDTIDQVREKQSITDISFLKIDVQGFEEEVLRGASESLREQRIRVIQFEHEKGILDKLGKRATATFSILAEHGYQVYGFDQTEKKFYGPLPTPLHDCANYYASYSDLTATIGNEE